MFKHSDFRGKKACVLGGGKSGLASARLLKRKGFKVLLSDGGKAQIPSNIIGGVEVESGGHTKKIFDCDFFIKSPGILPTSPIIKKLKKLKKPIFSEIELAIAYAPKDIKIYAITGTNGKTTTTEMLSEVMRCHVKEEGKNRKVYTLGNVGRPFADVADTMQKGSIVVLEISSYQLEDSAYFRPYAAALLNITPDHLEHHGSLKKYIEAKARIFKDQKNTDAFIFNADDKLCVKLINKPKSRAFSFSLSPTHPVRVDVFYDGDEIIFADGYRIKPPKNLPGLHNIENAMAASLLAFVGGVSQKAIQKGFDAFGGIEHRIEYFAEHKGIKCYNDSKSTNVDSTIIALKALQSKNKIWLILGGLGKGAPYTPLTKYLEKHCKQLMLIGADAGQIKKELKDCVSMTDAGNIANAVDGVFAKAKAGDILLLSPACASFDQFKNFEERGKIFKEIVLAKKNKRTKKRKEKK
ncbi:MAG: UDP-N-acetylmuramoyl-L-alanine--D-glutamate ligase [Elusimicrobiota bacterium]|jgi:UDP-N-acetylmuramoylalanine--D-glutamate ligase|nr:UDP-N-acetylmuramoyl-L-alanine--D-glutamate ligase [Elusimicrobiota bacterium]